MNRIDAKPSRLVYHWMFFFAAGKPGSLAHSQAHLYTMQISLLPQQMAWPVGFGFGLQVAIIGHFPGFPTGSGTEPEPCKIWLDALFTSFHISPTSNATKWSLWAWVLVVSILLWVSTGLGPVALGRWPLQHFLVGRSFAFGFSFCFGLGLGLSGTTSFALGLGFGFCFCLGQSFKSFSLILGQIICSTGICLARTRANQ